MSVGARWTENYKSEAIYVNQLISELNANNKTQIHVIIT